MADGVLIRKQKIKLRTSDEQLALRLRKLMNDTLQHDLTNMLAEVMAPYASSDQYIHIDKLHLDLGNLSAHNFGQFFVKQVQQKLVNELQKQLKEYMNPVFSAASDELTFVDNTGSASPFLQLKSAAEQEVSALVYFLEKGIYPWWYPKSEQKTPTEILDLMPEDEVEKLLLKIISLYKKPSPDIPNRILMRLFWHLPETKYALLIRRLSKLYFNSDLNANVELIIINTGSLAAMFSIQERKVYQYIISFLLQKQEQATENFFTNLFKQILLGEGISMDEIKKRNQQANTRFNAKINETINTMANTVYAMAKTAESELNQVPPAQQKDNIEKTSSTKRDQSELEEAIYINNAGLILLHPFLNYLFTDTGLLTNLHQFVSEPAQHKAAIMMYYLQRGQTDCNEWEMPLNKIMSGLDYQDVLHNDIILSEEDMQNCDNLLKAVVNHWEALKGAGIDALRNTFLLREGKISHKENHWLLQIERTGADILLDRLPWGYSTVKLPWLDQLILTEW